MDVGIIDHFANGGSSFLHRASAVCKIVFVALILASIVITDNFMLLLSIYFVLVSLVILTGLPFLKIISIATYPAIFAVLFATASWNGSWIRFGGIVFKALGAALSMVLLIVTTPYPSIFASINPFLPKVVVEGLFLTYRSLFTLLELMENLVRALKIRGGLSPRRYVKNVTNFSSGIGLLLIRGFDLSERLYGVMKVRGYSGRMSGGRRERFNRKDLVPVVIGVLVFALSLGPRFESGFSRYSVYILTLSLLFVFITALYAYFYAHRGVPWKNW